MKAVVNGISGGWGMKYTKKRLEEAAKLLASTAWQGDHGFTGGALVAWMTMKDAYLKFLIAMVAGKEPSLPLHLRCPCTAAEDEGHVACRGTSSGSRWTIRVRNFKRWSTR